MEAKNSSQKFRFFFLQLTTYSLLLFLLGCGYSTSRLLPAQYKTIYIGAFTNEIPTTEEVSERLGYRSDIVGIQEEVTQGVISRFLFDGNLRVTTDSNKADLILTGKLIDFYRQALRESDDRTVEEYRLNLVASVVVRDRSGIAIVEEPALVGDATYTLTGASARSETAAIRDLITDFSRRVVETVVEHW